LKTVCYRENSINPFRWGMLLRLFLILIIALPVSASPVYEGKVVGISDGDTITVLVGGHQPLKVRLAEIDAPEKSQAYGQRSKQSLSNLAFGKQVRVEQQDRDRYGRVVGKVYVGSLDVNAEQVKRGMAWVYRNTLSAAFHK
jgi:micrococcal nuclease